MSMLKMLLYLLLIFVIFSFIHYAAKSKKPFKRALFSVVIGLFALFFVNLLGALTGVFIPVTGLSVLTCAAGGLPGVALLIMLSIM